MAYPGDASHGAPPREFINCRCAMLPVIYDANGKPFPINKPAPFTAPVNPIAIPDTTKPPIQPASAGPVDRTRIRERDFRRFKNNDEYREYWQEWDEDVKKLPEAQKEALHIYTGSSYGLINRFLRRGKPADMADDFLLDTISEMSAAMVPIKQNVIVNRGSGYGMFPGYEDGGNPPDNDYLKSLVGVGLTEKAFMSTSIGTPFVAKVNLEIMVPAGTRGFLVAPFSRYEDEQELILDQGTTLNIISVEITGEGSMRRVKIIAEATQNPDESVAA